MVRDGIPFVVIPLVLAFVPLVFGYTGHRGYWPISVGFVALAAFMAFFFRDPHRVVPQDPDLVLAPADGLITLITREAGLATSESLVSIFLSPLDVHVNRSPIGGEITDITYKSGKFLMATSAQARLLNEQNTLTIRGNGLTIKCTQIAGILARRIVCWKQAGEKVECGERFGMIKFGSRTDLLMPANVEILVKEGMRVRGGETIIGKVKR